MKTSFLILITATYTVVLSRELHENGKGTIQRKITHGEPVIHYINNRDQIVRGARHAIDDMMAILVGYHFGGISDRDHTFSMFGVAKLSRLVHELNQFVLDFELHDSAAIRILRLSRAARYVVEQSHAGHLHETGVYFRDGHGEIVNYILSKEAIKIEL